MRSRYTYRRRTRQQHRRNRLDALLFVIVVLASVVGVRYALQRPMPTRSRPLPLIAAWGDCQVVQRACEQHGSRFVELWRRDCVTSFQCGRLIALGHCDDPEGC
jgi:hypothetical protein